MFNSISSSPNLAFASFGNTYRMVGDRLVVSDDIIRDRDYIFDIVRSMLDHNKLIQVDPSEASRARMFGFSYGTVEAGGVKPTLTDVYTVREGVKHDNFEERKRAGEIMVSDYERVEIRVRRTPGLKFAEEKFDNVSSIYYSSLIESGYCHASKWGRYSIITFTNGIVLYDTFPHNGLATYNRSNFLSPLWSYPTDVSAESLYTQIMNQKPDSLGLTTNVVAKANRASLDFLTAMAEMPKALRSAYAGLKQVVNLVSDVRKGEALVKNKFGARKRDLNLKFHRDLTRLKTGLADPKISSSRKRVLKKRIDELNASHSRSLISHADEFATALADVWLNFRYNIMPNVYVTQDTYEALDRYMTEYITTRGFKVTPVEINVPGFHSVSVDARTSVVIRRNFSAEDLRAARSVISNDIFVTAWELVPLSFVVDWFINIGDVLSSMTYNPSWAQEGATIAYSVKDLNFSLTPIDTDNSYSVPPTISVVGFVYERSVFDPTSSCGLVWNPTVGLARQVDAVALSWQPVRSLLINLKGRKT